MEHFNENIEQPKLKYVIMDISGIEPIVLHEEITDNPDRFVENYEAMTKKRIADNPNLVVAAEDPSEDQTD